MARWNDVAVYFGLGEEDEGRSDRQAASVQPIGIELLLRGVVGVVCAVAVVGLVQCVLDGAVVTVGGVLERGWLAAVVIVAVALVGHLRDRRSDGER